MERTETKPWACETCYLVFDSEESLKTHNFTCRERKPFVCEVCHLVFDSECVFIDHRLTVHEKDNSSLQNCSSLKTTDLFCESIGLKTEDDNTGGQHLTERINDHKELEGTTQVETSVQDGKSVDENEKKTTTEKLYQCEQCQKCFKSKYRLKRHFRMHTGEKPFSCDLCGRAFADKCHMKEHRRIHTRNNPYADKEDCTTNVKEVHAHKNNEMLVCSFCNTKVPKSELAQHFMTHKSIRLSQNSIKAEEQYEYMVNKDKELQPAHKTNNAGSNKISGSSIKEENVESLQPFINKTPLVVIAQEPDGKKQDGGDLKHNVATCSEGKPRVCEDCNLVFENDEEFICHELKCDIDSEDLDGQTETGLCVALKKEEDSAESTESKFSKEVPFVCDIFPLGLSKENIKTHQNQHGNKQLESSEQEVEKITKGNKDKKTRKVYQCELCGKYLKTNAHLKRHMKIHTGVKPFCCDVCGKSFKEKGDVKRHRRIHEKNDSEPNVTFVFEDEDTAFERMKPPKEKPHKCDLCDKFFAEKWEVVRHRRTHTENSQRLNETTEEDKAHQCDVCYKSFWERRSLNMHMIMHTGEKKHQCNICGRAFLRKNHYNYHMRIHSGEKPHVCDQCGKAFICNSDLTKHFKRVHTEDRPFQCTECGKTFPFVASLNVHYRQAHSSRKPFECTECGKAFSLVGALNQHVLRHNVKIAKRGGKNEEKNHQCDVCHQTFGHHVLLKQHKIRVHEVKWHCCDICGKKFYSKGHLKQHLPMHTGEKNFRCNNCGKSFGHNSSLSNHRRKSCPMRMSDSP